MTTEEKPAPRTVKCAGCGWVHFALSAKEIREFVTAENAAGYRNCSRCGTPDNFVPAGPGDAPPLLANVPGCVYDAYPLPRLRTGEMDAVVKHASSNERYAFDAACSAVGNALKKGPVDLEALALATGVSVEVLRTFAAISDPENEHLFTASSFLRRKVSDDFLQELASQHQSAREELDDEDLHRKAAERLADPSRAIDVDIDDL